jgi:hypothetical protein
MEYQHLEVTRAFGKLRIEKVRHCTLARVGKCYTAQSKSTGLMSTQLQHLAA